MTRKSVASLAGVSESTVYQWERGTRRPTPAHLAALVQGMPMDGATAGLIAEALGLDPVPAAAYRYLRGETIAGRPDLSSLEVREIDVWHIQGEIETHPWPCLVVDGAGVIACANRKVSWLLEHVSGSAPGQRPEMFALVGSKWFRERCLDWASCVPVLLEFPARLLPRPPEPSAAARHFVDSQPGGCATVEEMERLRAAYDPEPASRAFTVLKWREGQVDLTFYCVVSPWNIWDPYVAIDLHPGDGATWRWINASGRRQDPGLR
ncbi:MAG: helix-turn-helix transcriptional regulator [Dehalococcoidia bacterium]|nr:helix-turn-helix transcriptional regulator [Dehalococcoidia bacterium]